eukprot:m.192336 g.192336  ORF g.192336 m.192336 type:complete len:536 (+) comp14853_c0_seq1:85-1692(+)
MAEQAAAQIAADAIDAKHTGGANQFVQQPLELRASVLPSDELFKYHGVVKDATTPTAFVNAVVTCPHCPDGLTIHSYIQSGTFGRGWKAVSSEGRVTFLKTLRSPRDRPANSRAQEHIARKELEVFVNPERAIPPHKHIVTTAWCDATVAVASNGASGPLYVAHSELCEAGELFDYLVFATRPYVQNFSVSTAKQLFRQLVSGVAFLHSLPVPIFHRDLKLENIVLTSNFVLKIMDFGAAKWGTECTKEDGQYITKTIIGTPQLQPPELRSGNYSPGAFDVWSVGGILLFLLNMESFHRRGLNFNLLAQIASGPLGFRNLLDKETSEMEVVPKNEKFWTYLPNLAALAPSGSALRDLFNRIFDRNFKRRITAPKLLAHSWFAEGEGTMCTEVSQSPEDPDFVCTVGTSKAWPTYLAEMEDRAARRSDRARMLPIDLEPYETTQELVDFLLESYKVVVSSIFGVKADKVPVPQFDEALSSVPIIDPEGNVRYIVFITDDGVKLSWESGTLADWLTFAFSLERQVAGQPLLAAEPAA